MKNGKDLLALKRKKHVNQGMWTIFRIWEWTLATSQDVHGNLSNTATAAGFFQPSTKVRTQLYAGRLQRSHIKNAETFLFMFSYGTAMKICFHC